MKRRQRGFTYAMVLVAIAIVAIVIEAAHLTTWRVLQADREAELLYRGTAYRRAIENYYKANGKYPRELPDLLKDSASATPRRHLRALYPDPMAKGETREWTLVRAKDGGIAGVASTGKGEPLKQANFPKEYERFASAKSYSEWIFEYAAPTAALPRLPGSPPRPMVPAAPDKRF